ncbi:MAG: LPS export ABC transporter permease LptF [Desulfuromusa sp.]|nr:LPS export ABC transporter permease LptF [Desulfuromusa sp.]
MLINRYLYREILTPLVSICAILVIIFTGYSVARYLPSAVNGLMTGNTVLALVGLKVLIALEVLVPITLFFSVITVLGRMHAESEIVAFEACGLSERSLLLAVLRISLLIAVFVAVLSLFVRPWAYEESYWLKADAEVNFDLSRLRPGRFNEMGENKLVVFLEKIDGGQQRATGVFVQQPNENGPKITRAKEAWQKIDPVTGKKIIVLHDGYHTVLTQDGSKTETIRFKTFLLPLISKEITSIGYRRKAASTKSLAASSKAADKAEFQWRMSTGFSTVLLALIGVPLSRTSPRGGKYAKTFLAAIVFAAYYNMTAVAKMWVEQGVVDSFPGIWWPHILLTVLLFVLVMRSDV